MMLCEWGLKAGIARVWWQVTLCNLSLHVSYLSALDATKQQIYVYYFTLIVRSSTCLEYGSPGFLCHAYQKIILRSISHLVGEIGVRRCLRGDESPANKNDRSAKYRKVYILPSKYIFCLKYFRGYSFECSPITNQAQVRTSPRYRSKLKKIELPRK